MEQQQLQQKPTFQEIRQRSKTRDGQPITQQEIVTCTGLTLGEVYVIEIGGYSSAEKIQAVLRIFNGLTGQRLTVNDIRHQEFVQISGSASQKRKKS